MSKCIVEVLDGAKSSEELKEEFQRILDDHVENGRGIEIQFRVGLKTVLVFVPKVQNDQRNILPAKNLRLT